MLKEVLYIIIPAYNESANIRRAVEDWYPVAEAHSGGGSSRLVVIDDGSTDDTYDILSELAQTRPMLEVLAKENGGHGSAVLFGYRYAIAQGADLIFQTDSDGQTDPEEFEGFWREMTSGEDGGEDPDTGDHTAAGRPGRTGAVLGWRPDRQDGKGRRFVEKTLTRILRAVFHVKVPDANAPFRLMRASLVEKYLPLMPEDYNLPNVMLTTFFVYYRENVKFLPISFKPRQGGVNSINMKKIAGIGRQAMKDFRAIRSGMPPR